MKSSIKEKKGRTRDRKEERIEGEENNIKSERKRHPGNMAVGPLANKHTQSDFGGKETRRS